MFTWANKKGAIDGVGRETQRREGLSEKMSVLKRQERLRASVYHFPFWKADPALRKRSYHSEKFFLAAVL